MSVVYRFRPKVTEGNNTFDALYGVEYDEFLRVSNSVNALFKNNFLSTSNEHGVRNFEKIYEIDERKDLSLEERKGIVYTKMVYKPPFTRQRLNQILTNILGEGNFWFEISIPNFTVTIGISRIEKDLYDSYVQRMREIIPANMLIILSTPYTYLYLSGMIYGSNRVYTNVGEGNGDYIRVASNNYVYVGEGNGDYSLSPETDFTNENKLCYYTYRELSLYSVFDTTLEIYSFNETRTYIDGEIVTSETQGEIIPLAGAGIAYLSEM